MSIPARRLPLAPPAPAPPAAISREPIPLRPRNAPPAPEWKPWRRITGATAASQLFTQIGFGLGVPFLPLYVQSLGVTERADVALWTGVLAAAAPIPMAVMSPIWGALADRFGLKMMLVRSMVGGAALVALMGYVTDVNQLLVLRILQGGITGSVAAATALVAASAPVAQLGFALGLVNMAMQAGNSIGPGLGGLLVGLIGFRWSFTLGGLLLLLGGLLCVVWVKEPPRRVAPRPASVGDANPGNVVLRTLRPFTWPRLRGILLQQFAIQFALAATYALLPLLLQDVERPAWLSAEAAAGGALMVNAFAAVAATPVLGPLVDRRGSRGVMLGSLLLLGVGFAAHAVTTNVWLVLALRLAVGVGVGGTVAALGVLTKRASPPGRDGAAYGASAAAQALGWGAGPLLGSAVAAVAGIPTLYVLCGVLVGALAVHGALARDTPAGASASASASAA